MYSGDEGEATGEDLELERYGLKEEQYSGSGESDTEEALYRQVHYNIGNNNNIQSTTEEDTKPTIGTNEYPLLPTSRDSTSPGRDINDETCIDIGDIRVASDDETCIDIGDIRVASDDEDGHDWKRVESNSKYKVSLTTKTKSGIADLRRSRKRKAVVVVSDGAESDIIFIDVKNENQKSRYQGTLKKEGNRNLDVKTEIEEIRRGDTVHKEEGNSRKRSWKKTSDDGPTKITKIDRTGWSSADVQTTMSETSKVVVIADDSSSSSVLLLDSERSEEDVSQPKRRPLKDGSEFFLDNKGMALGDVQRDKVSAEQGWKAERMKTKAMLKEGVEIIDVSSGDEDCMVIESCSEEEGLHVHFDEKGKRISPEASTSSANNSGKSKGKRKRGEFAAPGRYFVQSRQKHIRCHNCNEMGHLKSECPQPPHVPACILCGKRGHTDRSCPDALCFNCSLTGHQSRSCPVKRHIRYAKCTRCQMSGHLRKMCPDIWRQYHLTTEHGPIIKPNDQHHRSKQKKVYCSNCSQKGHRYYDCRSARFDEFVVFTYDKVCLYDRKHIGKMEYPAENKNADYLKLLRECKSGPTSSTKVQTRLHQGDALEIISQEDSPPLTKKRKLTEEKDREEESVSSHQETISKNKKLNAVQTFVRKEEESSSTHQEQTGKNKKINAVQTFVRTRVFGGKKGRTWEKQDEPVLFPSATQQKETETVSEAINTEREPISKITIPNTVKTFVRTRLFGGKRGRTWAQQEDVVMIPSKQKETKTVFEGGSIKLTKAQRKAQRKAQQEGAVMIPIKQKEPKTVSESGSIKLTKKQRKEQRKVLQDQKRQEAEAKRLIAPGTVHQELAEAKCIKHSAVLALNAVKREIKAALTKKREKEPPVPNEVTDAMSKLQKKKMRKNIRKRERREVRWAFKDKMRTDVETRKIDRVFKDARKICRDVNKQKRKMYSVPKGAQSGGPTEGQYPVWEDPGFAMSQRGFNLDNRLLEGTHHHDNRWTIPQTAPWEVAFPRSDVPYNNYQTFIDQPYGYRPAFTDGTYDSNPAFTEGMYNNSHALIDPFAHSKKKQKRGKCRHKQWFKEGS